MKTIFNNPKLESFFIGMLLGDSYIYNNIFYCKQISEDLINFKANFIKETRKIRIHYKNSRSKKKRSSKNSNKW